MSLLRKLAGETAIYGISYILSRVLHYVLFTIYLTHVFNAEEEQANFGIYRDLYFYVAILVVILTFRMETTYFRFAKEFKDKVSTMSMSFLGILSGAFLLILYLFLQPVADKLHYPELTSHLLVLGFVLLFDVMSAVPFSALRQQNRPIRFLVFKVGSLILNIVLVYIFIEWMNVEDKLWYIFFANMIASGLTMLLLLPVLRNVKWSWDVPLLKRMIKYAWPLVVVAVSGVIVQSSAISFQKYFLSDDIEANLKQGAIYAAGASLALLLNMFTVAFNYAAEPFFFANKDAKDSRKSYADVAMVFTLVGCVMMLFILGYLDIIQLILGNNFRNSIFVVPILLVGYLFLGIYYNLSAWYKLTDKTFSGGVIAVTGVIITVVINIALLPVIGVVASAWASFICYLYMCVHTYLQGQKHYPIPYNIRRMAAWILCTLICYALMTGVYNTMPYRIVSLPANTLIIIVYLIAMFRIERPLIALLIKRN